MFGKSMKRRQKHSAQLSYAYKWSIIVIIIIISVEMSPPERIRSNPRGHLLGYNIIEEVTV